MALQPGGAGKRDLVNVVHGSYFVTLVSISNEYLIKSVSFLRFISYKTFKQHNKDIEVVNFCHQTE